MNIITSQGREYLMSKMSEFEQELRDKLRQFGFPNPESQNVIIGTLSSYLMPLGTVEKLQGELNQAKQSKDQAYWERNQLVRFLTTVLPSFRMIHEYDPEWDPDWMNIIVVQTNEGQLSWHIHNNELPMFKHLLLTEAKWDGHTTEEKYQRLYRLGDERIRGDHVKPFICPECKDTDHLSVLVNTWAYLNQEPDAVQTVTDTVNVPNNEHDWDDGSCMSCLSCGFAGSATQFRREI
jgi:hypothetical protein